jgi:hypothetical protein
VISGWDKRIEAVLVSASPGLAHGPHHALLTSDEARLREAIQGNTTRMAQVTGR